MTQLNPLSWWCNKVIIQCMLIKSLVALHCRVSSSDSGSAWEGGGYFINSKIGSGKIHSNCFANFWFSIWVCVFNPSLMDSKQIWIWEMVHFKIKLKGLNIIMLGSTGIWATVFEMIVIYLFMWKYNFCKIIRIYVSLIWSFLNVNVRMHCQWPKLRYGPLLAPCKAYLRLLDSICSTSGC